MPPRKKSAPQAVSAAFPLAAPIAVASPNWLSAAHAADAKKASNIRVLDLREITSFADYFVLASGSNAKQTQAICDEVERRLRAIGERPNSVEGYETAGWILMDYGDMVVHVFTEQARSYYDLDRLWRDAKVVAVPPER